MSSTFTTTSNCADINYRVFSSNDGSDPQGRIRVCFVAAGYCQSSWTTLSWDPFVVASSVVDGTTYRLEIDWTGGYGNNFEAGAYA